MTRHQELSAATGVRVYFCDPHSPWLERDNYSVRRIDSSELQLALTCCLT
jgi:IS30 family transposase